MKINSINNVNNNQSSPSFSKLKNIRCVQSRALIGIGARCNFYEERIANELKDVAKKNTFFQDYDVKAYVNVRRGDKSSLLLQCKPAAKTFKEKIKNFFSTGQIVEMKRKYNCPDDSSFYLAKDIREIGESDKLYKLLEETLSC